MPEPICISCDTPKATRTCGICQGDLCKRCTEFIPEGAFAFLKTIPEELSHDAYCGGCYADQVSPALASYEAVMEQAKEVYVFFTSQKKGVPLIQRGHEKLEVTDCPDRDETILRLAFAAAERSFNALIEVEVTSEKTRNGGYQKSKWRGIGFPARIDASRMRR